MRTVLIVACCLTGSFATAQEAVSSGGGHYAGSAVQISTNIGEPVITTVGTTTNVLTQGFEQPWADVSTTVPPVGASDIAISVYPNPVRHDLNIALGREANDESYRVSDAAGRLIVQGRLSSSISTLDMSSYASGNYQLTLHDRTDTPIATFRIIVNQ